jgi:cyanophycinase
MPAPVPPGYTRGPILFFGASSGPHIRPELLQTVWTETGAYGTRLVIVAVEPALDAMVRDLAQLYRTWECDQVEEMQLGGRAAAFDPARSAHIEGATGIILLAQDPLRLAATLGGTPLAQAIRRGNARGKAVAGIGSAATFLCQHMLASATLSAPLREVARFAPGLGLINRLLVDATTTQTPLPAATTAALLAAVAINPFLVGVGLEPDTAAILYPDETLQIYGVNGVTIVDGAALELPELDRVVNTSNDFPGAVCHRLDATGTVNLNTHETGRAEPGDSPPTGPVTSVF